MLVTSHEHDVTGDINKSKYGGWLSQPLVSIDRTRIPLLQVVPIAEYVFTPGWIVSVGLMRVHSVPSHYCPSVRGPHSEICILVRSSIEYLTSVEKYCYVVSTTRNKHTCNIVAAYKVKRASAHLHARRTWQQKLTFYVQL